MAKSSSIHFKPIQESESEIQCEAVKLKMIDGYIQQLDANLTTDNQQERGGHMLLKENGRR